MSLGFTGSELPFRASLKTPAANAALFHQSSYKFGNGLTISAGLRLDYDFQRLDLRSGVASPIDFQFAIDRTNYRECEWMQKNRKYQYVVFGVNHDLGLGVWNDAAALLRITEKLPQGPKTKEVMEKLRKSFTNGLFRAPPGVVTKIKLWFYALSLVMQKFLHRKDAAKCARLETRLNRIRCVPNLESVK
jgi:hypothetical protein